MSLQQHHPQTPVVMGPIADSERKFKCMHAETTEDVGGWYTSQSGGAQMHIRAHTKTGPVAEVSNMNIAGFDLRVFDWRVPVHGLCLSDTSAITINIPLGGTRTVEDQHFGKVSFEKDQAAIYRLDEGTTVVSQMPHSLLHLILPVKLLEARARSIYGTELNEPLRFSPVINLSKGGAAIRGLFGMMLAEAVVAPDALRTPAIESSLRELIISNVFGTLAHNYDQEPPRKVGCAAPASVKRAEDYMRAYAEEPISVQTLAREAGCSERALQAAFKSFRAMSPMAALREIRMEKARQDLLDADDTVTQIALKWGFTNPGRFAKQYADKFGETPSQTRRF